MERWLTQRMAAVLGASAGRADGICANVDFPFPRRLIGGALAAASGIDPKTDPWLPERLVWPLLEIVEAMRGDLVVGEHLDFAAVRHVAVLFDRYALHRPQLVRSWSGHWQAGPLHPPVHRVARPRPAPP